MKKCEQITKKDGAPKLFIFLSAKKIEKLTVAISNQYKYEQNAA